MQRSDTPRAGRVQQAIARAVREFGSRGCALRVAQEFGDHPETAVERMRWARQVVDQQFGATRLQAAHAHRLVSSVVAHATYAA